VERFSKIWGRAAKRKGGDAELEALLPKPKSARALAKISDDRWLSGMTQHVFSAGFVWKVVENKWPGFEKVFNEFDPLKNAKRTDKALEKIAKDERIIRNRTKVWSVRDNARWIVDAATEHGSFGKFIAKWPADDMIGLYDVFKQEGSRLGGMSSQWLLRWKGKDTWMLSSDVIKALAKAKVIEKAPTSKKDKQALQTAFNAWAEESGRPLCQISKVLACSV
jgi:3-methyladenine DNA glycosylase Tag